MPDLQTECTPWLALSTGCTFRISLSGRYVRLVTVWTSGQPGQVINISTPLITTLIL
jgi:hypothetical protein